MSWIKRNLYFVIGGVVAVALLALAGFYCYSKWQLNNQSLVELDTAYTDWGTIVASDPNPGNAQVDNIALAREQQKKVREKIAEVRKYFTPIPAIPDPNSPEAKDNLASMFRSSLSRTIDQLQRDAANANVTLTQPNYYFSFRAQRGQFNFPAGSLGPLAVQLGEVKAICDVLFRARINSLDNLQRERMTPPDSNDSPTDYIEPPLASVTNDLAVLSPYVITFRCFSTELASVLSGFGSGNRGFIVKAVNVEPAGSGSSMPGVSAAPGGETANFAGGVPGGYPGGGYPGAPGGIAPPPQVTTRGGLIVALDERPLKVVLVLDVVKLLPPKK